MMIWKDIKEHEGIYEISDTGLVRSVDRRRVGLYGSTHK